MGLTCFQREDWTPPIVQAGASLVLISAQVPPNAPSY
jgi:hypothetical protein